MFDSLARHRREIGQGGWPVTLRKVKKAVIAPVALTLVLAARVLRPWLLIRFNALNSIGIGHFTTEPELYLCEREAGINVPRQRYTDLCYFSGESICNQQLARMWARRLTIWPAWLLTHADWWNQRIPGGVEHRCKAAGALDRDVHDLLPRSMPHLSFTAEEERRGRSGLAAMGVPPGTEFICIHGRDPAFSMAADPKYAHEETYRDFDIQSLAPAAEALADLGYYVIRMGSIVTKPLASRHPKVIDYAASGHRNDFMDIYLGARCLFFLGNTSGLVCVPIIFRRPTALVNFVPLGYFFSFLKDCVGIAKRHWHARERRWLALSEIAKYNLAMSIFSTQYEASGVELVDNSPEEIKGVALEVLHRVKGTWRPAPEDEALQKRFWALFPLHLSNEDYRPLHGTVRARFGAQFLRDHPEFLA